jgi:hypothetical protein
VKVVFDAFFVLVYTILIFALWVVLLTRWIYIWLYVMFSPIAGLLYFFKKSKEWVGESEGFFKKLNVKDFIWVAFVPVYAMAALSFGFLFLYLVSGWIKWELSESERENSNIFLSWSTITIWRFSLEIKWNLGSAVDTVGKRADYPWIIWSLIVKILGIIVLWWSMIAALKAGGVVSKSVLEPLEQITKGIWTMVTKAPQYIPIFPWGHSLGSLGFASSTLNNYFGKSAEDRWRELAMSFNGQDATIQSKIDKIIDENFTPAIDNDWRVKALNNAIAVKDFSTAFRNQRFKDALEKVVAGTKDKNESDAITEIKKWNQGRGTDKTINVP